MTVSDNSVRDTLIQQIWINAAVLIGLSFLLFYKTRFGMQVRAVMQNKEMASAFGINADRVYMITFAIGAGLAGIAGSLFGVLAIVLPNMGANYVVQAFLVVVVGGGTILGSVVLICSGSSKCSTTGEDFMEE